MVQSSEFETAFSIQQSLSAWEKVGASPLTLKSCESRQVHFESGHTNDEMTMVENMMEKATVFSHFLYHHKYDGKVL